MCREDVHSALSPLWHLVRDAGQAEALEKAVLSYTSRHDVAWPVAAPSNYTMGWCDCQGLANVPTEDGCVWHGGTCADFTCATGYFVIDVNVYNNRDDDLERGVDTLHCCRPCFTVPQ